MFWALRTNDEGVPSPERFFSLVKEGKIELIAPTRATRFGDDGRSIVLADGSSVEADALVFATGFSSSWKEIFDGERRVAYRATSIERDFS